jgi:hypothetical protein
MPDMQSMPNAAMPATIDAAPAFDDFDFALGCECADPALQIERWSQENSSPGGQAN